MKLGTKKIAVVAILASVLLVALTGNVAAAPPWSDAPDSWWSSTYGVTAAAVATVADGYPDGTYKPTNSVTRGQFAKMAVNGLGVATADPATPTFKDVVKGSTFFIHIEGAYDAGLIGGYPVTGGLEFRPGNNISRQQTNSILGRYLSQIELDTFQVIRGVGDLTYPSLALWYEAVGKFYLNGFFDANKVASDHKANTAYLVYHGVVQGSQGYLNPTATLNRAQAAVMVLRVADVAQEITTPPQAPTGLAVEPDSPGNDPTPQVSGVALPNSPVAVYDTFGGTTTKLTEDSTNSAGIFYADLTVPLVDGTHVFTAKVKNSEGLVSSASAPVTYVLDTVDPTGTVTAPTVPTGQADAAVKLVKPAFTVSATDERSGVESVEFQFSVKQTTLDWETISTDTVPNAGTNVYTAEWPATGTLASGLTDGQYLFRAIISDNAGNTVTLASVEVTVDTTAPTIQIAPGSLEPETDDIFYSEDRTPLFGATGSDVTGGATGTLPSGVAKVDFLYAPIAPAPDAWNDFSLISSDLGASGFATYNASGIPVSGMPDGHYLFAVRATDRAGNESLLMSTTPGVYVAGVTQEVVIDNEAPVVTVTAPTAGALLPDETALTITWTLTDVSAPNTVKIEYSPTGEAPWTIIAAAAPFTPGSPGSYAWPQASVPDITGADVTTYKIRITAVDEAGTPVGDVAGHTTAATSGAFTFYDEPAAATSVEGSDPDASVAGVDWHDFHATWTPSTSTHIASQKVFLLPAGETLDLDLPTVDAPVATFGNNTTAEWNSTSALTTDSRGAELAAGDYKIWIVVTDPAGRTAQSSSPSFAVVSDSI